MLSKKTDKKIEAKKNIGTERTVSDSEIVRSNRGSGFVKE